MKTNNTQHKTFAFLGAAFALLIALLFTACPNNAGDSGSGNSGGGGGTPVSKYAVTFGVEAGLQHERIYKVEGTGVKFPVWWKGYLNR